MFSKPTSTVELKRERHSRTNLSLSPYEQNEESRGSIAMQGLTTLESIRFTRDYSENSKITNC